MNKEKAKIQRPSAGGCYVRKPDGALEQVTSSTGPALTKAELKAAEQAAAPEGASAPTAKTKRGGK